MSALLFGYYVVGVSVLLGAGALLLEGMLRSVGRGGRWAWLACLGGSVGLPLVAVLLPQATSPSPTAVVLSAPVLTLAPVVAAVEQSWFDLGGMLRLGWLLSGGVLALLVVLSHLALRREARQWRRSEVAGETVWLSPGRGPAVVGLRAPRIVLPEWVLGLGPSDLRFMILHEQEHVRARDPALVLAGLGACVLAPWNPVAWWALHRLRGAIELDCDARVLARAGDPAGYGRLLLEVGRRRTDGYLLAAAFAEPRVLLERRVRALLQWPGGRRPALAVMLGAAALLCFGAACELDPAGPKPPGPAELPPVGAVAPAPQRVPLDSAPTFTPMTVRPELINVAAVQERLVAEYPPALRAAGIGGKPAVWFLIDETGRVARTRLSDSSGHPALDSAALSVAAQMQFKPAENRGRPVPVWVEIPIVFAAEAAARAPRDSARRLLPPPPPSPQRTQDRSAAPTFTPFTRRPELRNAAAVQQLLIDRYPPALRAAGVGGRTVVWVFIDSTGTVANAQVSTSSGEAELDQAALLIARQMQFSPAYDGEKPTAVWVEIPLAFSAQQAPAQQRPQQGRAVSVRERPLLNAQEVRAALVRSYPPLLRDAGIGGEVLIWVYAEADGRPTKTQVAKSSGRKELDEAALKLVQIMRFAPAPSAGWIELPVSWSAK